ncbi:MAG: hypothetical protein QOH46_1648 [Solirubrobacteraceae bacterium]|nr:hypothetical protein [Solirubrobacteraceae bacterium]
MRPASMIRDRVRRHPAIADAVRAARRLRARRRPPVPTAYGFVLQGGDRQGTSDFEPDETALVLELLPAVDVFVDIGANVGLYSCLARSRGVEVIAVEPLRSNVELLLANLVANGWDDALVLPLALGARTTVAPMFGDGTGASLTRGWAGVRTRRPAWVPITTADEELLPRIGGRRSLIKVDVEGGELDLLAGAGRLLRAEPAPAWLVEVNFAQHHPEGQHPAFARVMHAFWETGYTVRTLPERRTVSPEDVTRWTAQGHADFGSHNYLCTQG